MPSWKLNFTLCLLASGFMLLAGAQPRTYLAFDANVPFSFHVGDRKFQAGDYEFVVAGPGLMVMRDGKKRALTTLFTRDLRAEDRPGPPRLVFEKEKGRTRLVSIWTEKGIQGFGILREQVSMPRLPPSHPELELRLPANTLRAPHR
jgi:hypothetical protein